MAKATLWFLGWLTLLVTFSYAVDQTCNYYQDLVPGTDYYLYNPEYPYKYEGAKSCMWTMKSDYRVNLTCETFNIPWSINCFQDRMVIQVDESTAYQYCGDVSFNIESKNNTMTVSLLSPYGSRGGRFLCKVEPIKRPEDSEKCKCGWKNPSRIVGGVETGVNEYPMMAGLVDALQRRVYCGGTIISIKHVLTAAHCIIGRNIEMLGVVVGEHDIRTGKETNATKLYRIKKATMHPNYFRKSFLNDIAVVELHGNIVYSNEVGPACLPFQHSPDTFGGSYVDILGWGTTEFAGPPSDTLQKATLSVLTNLECSESYKNLTSDQFCTYAEGKDDCQMDSGGPVLWQNPTTRRIVLIGIINYGSGCGVTSGVNCRVGGYIDWIVSVTPDTEYCIIE
ncbi:venom serine protease 34 [Colletes latitarsis]|uniref:venom serine protease 34 n=1 Tax=Colletes latitarsis TaxID=2605962 RepID=UPI004034F9B2